MIDVIRGYEPNPPIKIGGYKMLDVIRALIKLVGNGQTLKLDASY
jgi:hypothetical protein